VTANRLPRSLSRARAAVLLAAAGAALIATTAPADATPLATGEPGALSPQATARDALQALRALDALPATPNTAWGMDPATGDVVVTVSDAAQRAGVARLLDTAGGYGAPVRVRHTAGLLSEQQLLGGDSMDNGDVFCSAGFNVVKDGQPYVLTAGHCTSSMKTWKGVGPSVASNFPSTDFGLVRNDSARPAPGAVDLYNGSSQPITGVGTATVGEHVCASGMATGYTCGTVTAVNQTVDYGDGQVVHGLIETNVHTDHGDSGGPLFDGSTALGTVSGGDGTTDYFQPVAAELTAYGVTLAP
jgi:streptogrisin D